MRVLLNVMLRKNMFSELGRGLLYERKMFQLVLYRING